MFTTNLRVRSRGRSVALACASIVLVACGDDGSTSDDAAGSSTGVASTGGPGSTSGVDSTGGGGSSGGGSSGGGSSGGSTSGTPGTTDTGGSSSGSDATAGTESGSGSSTGAAATVQLDATFASFTGMSVAGDFCSVDGCVAIAAGAAALTVPANTEIDVWVEAVGFVDMHWQLATLDQDISTSMVVPAEVEASAVAGAFGVTLMPGMSQLVLGFTAEGIAPTIDAAMADGPYYISFGGAPQPGAMATGMGGSRVVFFNVTPGDWVVSVPGCDEGAQFWGTPSDNAMDVSLAADTVTGLFTSSCM